MTKFGQALKDARIRSRVTLREFCRRNGLDAANQSKYERGILPPPQDPEKIVGWLEAMGYSRSGDEVRSVLLAAAMELSCRINASNPIHDEASIQAGEKDHHHHHPQPALPHGIFLSNLSRTVRALSKRA
jgi:transcriptional regulator with XRE-family HTH domain